MPLIRAELLKKPRYYVPLLIHDKSQVLYLPFDRDDGSYARDRSGYNNHGVIYGATRVDGIIGKALSFDGVDDYMMVPDSDSLDITKGSVEVWVKPLVLTASWYNIISKWSTAGGGYDAYGMYAGIENGYRVRWQFYDGSWHYVDSTTALTVGKWFHIVGTYDGFTLKIYINGQFENSRAYTGSFPITAYPLGIGRGQIYYFNGLIDEVRIYNRALSQAEIQRLMYMRGIP
jgi:hypothetical protein